VKKSHRENGLWVTKLGESGLQKLQFLGMPKKITSMNNYEIKKSF
jgi:hypothetical protein